MVLTTILLTPLKSVIPASGILEVMVRVHAPDQSGEVTDSVDETNLVMPAFLRKKAEDGKRWQK